MQTPGEKKLIEKVAEEIQNCKEKCIILNIGAAKSLVIEKELENLGCDFIEDRTDVRDPSVEYNKTRNSYIASIENMSMLSENTYDIAFANYVLEHVDDIKSSAKEVKRILKDKGIFVASVPNPEAPEFILAKYTPTWFHQFIKGEGEGHEAHDTVYSFDSLGELIKIFKKEGLGVVNIYQKSFTYGYLYRFPILKYLSKKYDRFIEKKKYYKIMGNVCFVFKNIK